MFRLFTGKRPIKIVGATILIGIIAAIATFSRNNASKSKKPKEKECDSEPNKFEEQKENNEANSNTGTNPNELQNLTEKREKNIENEEQLKNKEENKTKEDEKNSETEVKPNLPENEASSIENPIEERKNYIEKIESMNIKEKIIFFLPILKAHDHALSVENCNNWFKEFLVSNDGNYLFAYFILGNSTLWIFDLTTKNHVTSFCTSMKKCENEAYKQELRNWMDKYPECVAKNWNYSTLN